MSLQRNLLIGVGALGALMVLGNVVSAEKPNQTQKDNEKEGEITDTGDPAYLSIVNPYGINPATGNTYCEDNDNCPDDGFGEPEEKKEDVKEDKSVVKDDKGRLDIDKTLKEKSKLWYRTTTLGKLGKHTQEGAAVEKKVKKTAKTLKDNKDIAIGAGLGLLSPIPGGALIGAGLGTKKGRKKAKKGLKKLKFWAEEVTPKHQTHLSESTQSFITEFF